MFQLQISSHQIEMMYLTMALFPINFITFFALWTITRKIQLERGVKVRDFEATSLVPLQRVISFRF